MLSMAAILLALVVGFFFLYLGPVMDASVDGVVHEYMHTVASTAPSYERAKDIGQHLNVETRYEGADGSWTTAADIPSVAEARRRGHGLAGHHYYVVSAPTGGTYVFAWKMPRQLYTAHLLAPVVVLVLVGIVVFAAHGVLKRLLLPVRLLSDGVARLSDGQLDVVVPKRSGDEFGTLTDAFNRMVRRIQDMIRARDQLLIDVSHELRSPLTRLKVALALVDDAEMKSRMAADVSDMELMISELLELERLRDGARIKTTRQNLVAILQDVARNFADRAPGVRLTAATTEIMADVDADRMRTVFRNLLENALKYSLSDSRGVEVSASSNGTGVVVRVTDDGAGIPSDDMLNLFEPFFRVDRSRSKKTGGYGLGLSIVKRIVEAHGGAIAVENNPTRGASFVVTLPMPA
jgi:signal transduction histidine kinase